MKTIEEIVITGDLSELTAEQRVQYYKMYCESIGVDWTRMPLGYIQVDDNFSGRKTILYALRNCADQLRDRCGISITELKREEREGYIAYKAYASVSSTGRSDVAIGAVATAGKTGQALANADMHADTKARRRVTLDICGVGLLDETEVADLNSKTERVDTPGLSLTEIPTLPAPSAAPGIEPPKPPAPPTITPEPAKSSITDNLHKLGFFGPATSANADMPTPKELEGYRNRMSKYRNEVFPKGGLVASEGLGVNGKIQRFFTIVTGAPDSKSMTKEQWEKTLTFLDDYLASYGAEGLVKYLDERIA